jgi:chemotaxis protein MotD
MDPSTNGLLSRTSSQGSDSGAFARALNDADDEAGTPLQQADEEDTSSSSGDGNSATARLTALKGLASLGSSSQQGATSGAGSATAVSLVPGAAQSAQTLPGALQATTAFLQAAGQSADPQAARELPQQTAIPAEKIKDKLTAAWPSGTEEQTDPGLGLGNLAATISGLKRSSTAGQGEAEKTLVADDAAAEGTALATPADSTALAAPADGQLAPSASAAALLQLMANAGTLAPAVTLESASNNPPAAAISANADTLDMPFGTDDADDTLDFLVPTGGPAEAADGKTFRLQKAGDAAVAISLSITKSETGGAEMQEAIGSTDQTDLVTVLDNRRYLGFGMGSNASNLLSAASGDRDWASAMHPASSLSNAASASSTGNVVNTLKLQLTPDNLGTVTANMRLQGDELSIHLTVHNAAAYRELSDDSKPMLEALRAQGFNVDNVTVTLSSSPDPNSSSGQSPANSNPNAQHQLPRDGEAARQQAQGNGQGRSSGQADSNDMENRNDSAVEASGRGSGNAGSLYL